MKYRFIEFNLINGEKITIDVTKIVVVNSTIQEYRTRISTIDKIFETSHSYESVVNSLGMAVPVLRPNSKPKGFKGLNK